MDSFIQDFSKLRVSKKKKSTNRQININEISNSKPVKVLIDPTILKINKSRLSMQQTNWYKVNEALTYIILDKYDAEFIDIKKLLAKSNLIVKSVRKVDNPYLKKAFELKRNLQYGGKVPRSLFHGTKQKYIDSICTYNFDWRYSGAETGHRHGKGVNFSPSPYFVTFFCDRTRKRVMIYADVLIDQIIQGKENMVVPPRRFDTTTGKNRSVFVKFYDNEFYPRYVIDFVMPFKR